MKKSYFSTILYLFLLALFCANDLKADDLKIEKTYPSLATATDGSIDLTITGGHPGFTIVWTKVGDSAWGTKSTEDIDNLGIGVYHVQVTDSYCCVATLDVELKICEIDYSPVRSFISHTCGGKSNGFYELYIPLSAILDPIPLPLKVSLTYNQKTKKNYFSSLKVVIPNLANGLYSIEVRDGNGCIVKKENFEIKTLSSDAILANIHNICEGSDYGSLQPYCAENENYNFTISSFKDELQEGNYCVTATNSNNGCTAIKCFDIKKTGTNYEINASIIPACAGDNGSITIGITPLSSTASSNPSDYTYEWFSYQPWRYNIGGYYKGKLKASFYSVDVRDAKGCVKEIKIEVPDLKNPNFDDIAEVELINPCKGQSNGSIKIKIKTKFSQAINFKWSDKDANGIAITSTNRVGLSVGAYTVTGTYPGTNSSEDCEFVKTFTLTDFSDNDILSQAVIKCDYGERDGSISLTTPTTWKYHWFDNNGEALGMNREIKNLNSGIYYLEVTDNRNCVVNCMVVVPKGLKTFNGCDIIKFCDTKIVEKDKRFINDVQIEDVSPTFVSLFSAQECTFDISTFPQGQAVNSGKIAKGANSKIFLSKGTYQVIFTIIADGITCTVTKYFTIKNCETNISPIKLATNDIQITPPSNSSSKDGIITLFPKNGSGKYYYKWDNGKVSDNNMMSGLGEGSHCVTITDDCESAALTTCIKIKVCKKFDNFTEFSKSTGITLTVIDINWCENIEKGTAVFWQSNENGDKVQLSTYSVQWDGIKGSTRNTNLNAGVHEFIITEIATGCSYSYNFTIKEASKPPLIDRKGCTLYYGCPGKTKKVNLGTVKTSYIEGEDNSCIVRYECADESIQDEKQKTYWVRNGVSEECGSKLMCDKTIL